MRESGFSFRSATTRCIVLFLLHWSLGSPAAEAQEAEALFRFFRAIPPWTVEAPGVARARFGLGLDVFFERQESLRIASQEKTLRLRDVPSGREETELLREDPRLLNRKFDILLELEGGGSELSVPLPDVPILGLSPSLVFQAAAADVHLDFLDRNRAADSTSYDGRGSLFGTGLDLTASLCRSCPWFAGASYRFQKIPSHDIDRSPAFSAPRFEILEDETRLGREVHEISARAGYSLPGNRIASYIGVRRRSTTVQIDDELRYRDPFGITETHISTRSKLDSDTTLALAGLEAHLAGPFYARIDTALGEGDRVVWANLMYLVPRQRVRIVSEEPILWPTLAMLLELGPDIKFRRNFVTGFGVVAGGWPVVVDYELEKEGFLILTVSTQGRKPQEFRLPPAGMAKPGERQDRIVKLPMDFGSEFQPGLFTLQAFAASKPEKPIDFAFYGIGAGQGAIASLAIDQVRFKPSKLRPRAEYSFRSLRKFNKVKIFIFRNPEDPDAFPILVQQKELSCTPGVGATCSDQWDGRDDSTHQVSRGLHILQINAREGIAWEGTSRDPSWLSAVSPEIVEIP
ncbi:MAG TPA: hypothetical protein VKM72_34190 [Thermoanaerobaculia bacterium]|nr:hypothetical protein [Thermoanaerobaculia bacterium]